MKFYATPGCLACSLSLSLALSLALCLARATLQSKHNLPLLALHTLLAANGKGKLPSSLPPAPYSPTCLPPLWPLSRSLTPLCGPYSGPSSRRQRHPLSLLPNYRAFNFNFDVACGKHVARAALPMCVCVCVGRCMCVCVAHTNPEHEMALTGSLPCLLLPSLSLLLGPKN